MQTDPTPAARSDRPGPGAAAPCGQRLLSFSAAGIDGALDVGVVREIRAAERTTWLPGAPAALLGVIDLRGAVVPVMDLATLLAPNAAQASPAHRATVIVVERDEALVGLAVDAVDDVIEVDAPALRAVPPAAAAATPSLRALVPQGPRLLQWLDLERLLPAPDARPATEPLPAC